MIPKIIHYCWFGKNKKPPFIEKCISSWSKKLKDYQIKEWNDENIDELIKGVDSKFLNDAIKEEKYAFISDYIRLLALQKYGGIYLDTDVLVYKNFNKFLNYDLFLGFIVDCSLGTAVMGASKNSEVISKLLSYADDCYLKNKEFSGNNIWITKYFLDVHKDFKLNGKNQLLDGNIAIFEKQYFEAEKPFYKKGGISSHKCLGSWIDESLKDPEPTSLRKFFKKLTPKFILRIRDYNHHYDENEKYPFYEVYKKELSK